MRKIDLSIFPTEREQKLKSIYRYSMIDVYFYRSNLWLHEHRVLWLVEELLPLAQNYMNLDPEKARVLALVHDDAEMITGDIQAGHKDRMSAQQLSAIDGDEEQAVHILAKSYPKKVHGYSYENLLMHALKKDCLEALLVSYADKLDAFCESMHELFAGNITSIHAVNFYAQALALFPYKYPELKEFLSSRESPLIYISDKRDPVNTVAARYIYLNKHHTRESIKIDCDLLFYDIWKNLVMKKGGEEGLNWLVEQREYIDSDKM